MISLRFNIRVLGIAAFVIGCLTSQAQDVKTDTTGLSSDSVRLKSGKVVSIRSYATRFDPRKALFYSAVLPGAGQVYNKKYWKVPLVYGGLLGLIEVVKFYSDSEKKYKSYLYYVVSHPGTQYYPNTTITADALRKAEDQAHRQRDYFVIITSFFYILQMVDAHVDAHLKEFDLNPNLHVRIEPSFNPMYGVGAGVRLRF